MSITLLFILSYKLSAVLNIIENLFTLSKDSMQQPNAAVMEWAFDLNFSVSVVSFNDSHLLRNLFNRNFKISTNISF